MPFLTDTRLSREGLSTQEFFQVSSRKIHDSGSPVAHLYSDTANLIIHLKLLPSILHPFWTRHRTDELYLGAPSTLYLLYFAVVSVVQTPFTLAILLATLIISLFLDITNRISSFVVWRFAQGPQFQVHPTNLPASGTYNPRHRWVYINGVATTTATLAQEIEFLSNKFSTPVLGINNRTYGFFGDLVECLVQRAFGYHTKETRIATEVIKSYLLESRVDTSTQDNDDEDEVLSDARTFPIEKIILIAHSQGGILASHILDSLLMDSDLSPSDLAKLEIYTFGSAAVTMNNPYADQSHTRRLIPVMEHYCNELDMVASWGAMSGSRDDKNKHRQSIMTRFGEMMSLSSSSSGASFKGKVFIRAGKPGHLLDQHYLRPMFDRQTKTLPAGKIYQNGKKGEEEEEGEEIPYLDRAVQQTDLVSSTDQSNPRQSTTITTRERRRGGLDSDARYIVLPKRADPSKGEKSVGEVSGLWRYIRT